MTPPDAAWAERMRTEQVRLIYRNYPFTLSANFVLSLLVIGALCAAIWGLLGWYLGGRADRQVDR